MKHACKCETHHKTGLIKQMTLQSFMIPKIKYIINTYF